MKISKKAEAARMEPGPKGRSVRQARLDIAAKIPELRVGDIWSGVTGVGEVLTIERLEDLGEEGYPWPMVHYLLNGGKYRTGAPAFMSGNLVKRGDGRAWVPPVGKEAA